MALEAVVLTVTKESGNLKIGIEKAIKYCKKHGILVEFLEQYAGEVLSMLYTEWNMEDALTVAREEEREKWQTTVADKEAIIADKDAEIERLKSELGKRQ